MKNQTNKFKAFLQLAILLSAIGFYTATQAQVVVNMDVNSSETKLVITTLGACSSAQNENGCVQASGVTRINFNLTGPAKCTVSGGTWALQHVALNPPVTEVAARDFKADLNTGIIEPVSKSNRHILIEDRNTEAYTVTYTVTATCGAATVNSDPRVINDGSGVP